jgi:hypothetical protein
MWPKTLVFGHISYRTFSGISGCEAIPLRGRPDDKN